MTGYPPNAQLSKTALGAEEHLEWEYRKDVISVIEELNKENYQLVLLEQMEGSCPYQDYCSQGPVCLVVGNENGGVDQQLIPYCDQAIEIEMEGIKNSLNVAVAFGIVAYHMKQSLKLNGVSSAQPNVIH